MKKTLAFVLSLFLIICFTACRQGGITSDTISDISQVVAEGDQTSETTETSSLTETSESAADGASTTASDPAAAGSSTNFTKTTKTTKTTKKPFKLTDAILNAFASVGAQVDKIVANRDTKSTNKGTTRTASRTNAQNQTVSISDGGASATRTSSGTGNIIVPNRTQANNVGVTVSGKTESDTPSSAGKRTENANSGITKATTSNGDTNTTLPTLTGEEELIELSVSYSLGGINANNGKNVADQTRLRSDYIPLREIYFKADSGCKYAVFYYNKNKQFLGCTAFTTEATMLKDCVADNTAFFRVVVGDVSNALLTGYVDVYGQQLRAYAITPDNGAVGSKETLLDLIKELFAPEYVSDVPENAGVRNALMNMKQLEQINYTPLKSIPQQMGDYTAGVTRTGLPYSSTRPEALFVGTNVSLHTFMTAVKNPNSYLYTVDLGELGNANGHTYYGTVCSTACGYALGIRANYSTHQWTEIPGMKVIDDQSASGLKLADTIVGKGHVVMITNITRTKRGKIGKITTTEAAGTHVFSVDYTPGAFERQYPASQYKYCRYTKVNATVHTPSPYVAVGDERPQSVTYNTAIIPRKGDKANWLKGQDVVIDVLKPDGFTGVEIYKDGARFKTTAIQSVITLFDLDAGSYKARLIGGNKVSDWCYWIVVDAASSVVACGRDGKVTVTFSASNATPRWVQWANGRDNGTVHITELTQRQIAAGVAECAHTAGTYKIRVAFETEYGIIHSELPGSVKVK